MKAKDTGIHPGGLFRCCMFDLFSQLEKLEVVNVGDTMTTTCNCKETVVLNENGDWRRQRKQEPNC